MGAASSVDAMKQLSMKDNIYISYADKDIYGETIHNELIRKGMNIIQGRFISAEDENEMGLFTGAVSEIMSYSNYIIIVVSEKTITSFHQAIEIQKALESYKNIIYIFTDKNFTPISTPYLNGLVGFNKWLPAYDGATLDIALDELKSYAVDI
jgi:hypothetical protein